MTTRRAAFLAAFLALAPGCSPPGPADSQDAVVARFRDAESAMEGGRFDEAARLFEAMADAVEATGVPELQGHRDLALYNAACCLVRAGNRDEAVEAFARSVDSGLRPARLRDGERWIDGPALRLEHILADPDLDALRPDPRYRAALRPYLAAGDLTVSLDAAQLDVQQPALLVLAAPDVDAVSELEEPPGGLLLAVLDPPVAPQGAATPREAHRWILGDGDERWALARVRAALDELDEQPLVAPARIYVAGAGPQSGTAALHVALAMPNRIAGVVITGAKFHPAGIADDVAAFARAKTKPRLAFGPEDTDLAREFVRAGVPVEHAETPAAAIARWTR